MHTGNYGASCDDLCAEVAEGLVQTHVVLQLAFSRRILSRLGNTVPEGVMNDLRFFSEVDVERPFLKSILWTKDIRPCISILDLTGRNTNIYAMSLRSSAKQGYKVIQ
jgi:hypothetical protein